MLLKVGSMENPLDSLPLAVSLFGVNHFDQLPTRQGTTQKIVGADCFVAGLSVAHAMCSHALMFLVVMAHAIE